MDFQQVGKSEVNMNEDEILEMSEEQNTLPALSEVTAETLEQIQGGLSSADAEIVKGMIDTAGRQTGINWKYISAQAGIGTVAGFGANYGGEIIGKGGKTHPNT